MLNGAGRHRLSGQRFGVRPSGGAPDRRSVGEMRGHSAAETATMNVPANTQVRSFAKPTSVGLGVGLVSQDPHAQITMAREMYDNDPVLGAVVDTLAGIPFGEFELQGCPRAAMQPYLSSVDRVRAKSLMPVVATSHLVDGAFLGTGLFDDRQKVWDAMIPADLLHATLTPVPFFGATPIVDLQIHQDALKTLRSTDPRMQRYLRHLPPEMLTGGVMKLEPENTFYVPRKSMGHLPIGTSIYRKVMIVYILEKALARGTIEMAYRRQRALTHIVAGDENWDPSIQDMKDIADLFQAADLDPLGAYVVTRQGVSPQELGGMSGDMFRWTDNMDVLNALKLKGLAMPDGLLGGDAALDSVSATLTVFINMTRQLRDLITNLFFYEKFFPYISITNGHRRDDFHDFREQGARYQSRASDTEVDMADFITPKVAWHHSLRPEGDQEYLNLLMAMAGAGVPVPIRLMAATGGLDVNDLINSAPEDVALREKVGDYQAQINQITQKTGGGQDPDGAGGYGAGDYQGAALAALSPIKRKGIMRREYDDRLRTRPHTNNKRHVTTPREYARVAEEENRKFAKALAAVARRENALARRQPKPQGELLSM